MGQAELQWVRSEQVRAPLQERSQLTLERILVSGESLINEVGFERATVAEIVKRAESSVGAFYTRFKDKDALLRVLLDRFVEQAAATTDLALRPELWRDASIEDLSEGLIRFMMRMFRERRLLLIAIAGLTLDEPELASFRDVLTTHAAKKLALLVETRGEVLACEDPARALRVAIWTCLSIFESSVIQGAPKPAGLEHEELVGELSKMVLAYLCIEAIDSDRRPA